MVDARTTGLLRQLRQRVIYRCVCIDFCDQKSPDNSVDEVCLYEHMNMCICKYFCRGGLLN